MMFLFELWRKYNNVMCALQRPWDDREFFEKIINNKWFSVILLFPRKVRLLNKDDKSVLIDKMMTLFFLSFSLPYSLLEKKIFRKMVTSTQAHFGQIKEAIIFFLLGWLYAEQLNAHKVTLFAYVSLCALERESNRVMSRGFGGDAA